MGTELCTWLVTVLGKREYSKNEGKVLFSKRNSRSVFLVVFISDIITVAILMLGSILGIAVSFPYVRLTGGKLDNSNSVIAVLCFVLL